MTNKLKLIVNERARSPVAEAFRALRTNIQFSKADGELRIIMVTSPGPAEGKSTVLANIAVSMAQAGRKVLILDCDLRKPVQHSAFRLTGKGLTNALAEGMPVTSLIQETDIKNLRVVTSGPIPPNPSELLGTSQMQQILNSLKEQCDVLLIDAPPVVAVTDASVLAARTDGVILVVNSGTTRPEMVQKAKDLLIKAHGDILGVVLNRVEIDADQADYYYYYGN